MSARTLMLLAIFLLAFSWGISLIHLKEELSGGSEPPSREAPIVVRLDLTPMAMKACAKAFVRFGFYAVEEYECRVERGQDGLVVALYGPNYRKRSAPVERLGEVPLE